MNFRYLTEYLDSLPGKLCAPGVDCKIMYKNEEVYRHSSGWFDMENNIPVKRDAQYYIYSTTKPLTCTTALTLYEKGKFLLSDPLYEYMPQFRDMYVKHYNEDGSFSTSNNYGTTLSEVDNEVLDNRWLSSDKFDFAEQKP